MSVCERAACVSVCVSAKKKFKNTLSRVARAFKDVKLIKNNQRNHIGMFMYLTQVEVGSYFSYFLVSVSWLYPFQNCT